MAVERSSLAEIHARLGRVEQEGAGFEVSLRALQDGQALLLTEITKLRDAITTGNKTNWSTLAAWAGVLLTITAICGTLVLAPLMRVAHDTAQTQRAVLIEQGKHDERSVWMLRELNALKSDQLQVAANLEEKLRVELKAVKDTKP